MKSPMTGGSREPPAAPSEKPKGASVNSDTTRSSTAKTPPTLGPRTA